jgi:hypothetical protein
MVRIDLRRIDKKMRPVVRAVRETGITHAELKVLAQEYRLAHPKNYEKIMQEYHVPRAYWIFPGKRLKEIKRIEARALGTLETSATN